MTTFFSREEEIEAIRRQGIFEPKKAFRKKRKRGGESVSGMMTDIPASEVEDVLLKWERGKEDLNKGRRNVMNIDRLSDFNSNSRRNEILTGLSSFR